MADPAAHRLRTAEGRRWRKEHRRLRRFVPGATGWQMALLYASLAPRRHYLGSWDG